VIQQLITDLGGILGLSIFGILLAIVGFVFAWGSKKKFYTAYLLMLAVFIISIFFNPAVVYSNFIVSILGGLALASLIKMKWKLKVIRNFSIILLFCGLIFSSVSYTVRIADQQPNAELMEALEWIRQNSNEGDVVFSHYTNGFWIQFQAQRPVVLDSLSDYSLEFEQRLSDSDEIFSSWNLESTKKQLSKYDVDFILITNDMYEGIVWDEPEEELAYLLRNSETFKKEYGNSYAGVWRFTSNKNG
jgi:hypothetical protein